MRGRHLGSLGRHVATALTVASAASLAGTLWLRRKALEEPHLPSAFFSAQKSHEFLTDDEGRLQRSSFLWAAGWPRLQALRGCSALLRGLDWLGTALPSLESCCHTCQKMVGYLAIQAGVTAPFRLRSSFPVPELRQLIEEQWSALERQQSSSRGRNDSPVIDLFIIGDTPDIVFQLATGATRAYPVAITWAQTGTLPPPTSSRTTSCAPQTAFTETRAQMPVPALRLHISLRDLIPSTGGHNCVQVLLRAGRILYREQDWMGVAHATRESSSALNLTRSDAVAASSALERQSVDRPASFRVACGMAPDNIRVKLAPVASLEWIGMKPLVSDPVEADGFSKGNADCRSLHKVGASLCKRLGTIDLSNAGQSFVTAPGIAPMTSPLDDAIRLHGEDMVFLDRLIDMICDLVEQICYSKISHPHGSREMSGLAEAKVPVTLVFHTHAPEYTLPEALPRPWDASPEPLIIGREVGSFEDLDPEEWAEFSQRLSTTPWWSEPGTKLALYWTVACGELLERIAHIYPEAHLEACDGSLAESIPPSTLFIGRAPGTIGLALVKHLASLSREVSVSPPP